MSFTTLAISLAFTGAAAFMLFAAFITLALGLQTSWRWMTGKRPAY